MGRAGAPGVRRRSAGVAPAGGEEARVAVDPEALGVVTGPEPDIVDQELRVVVVLAGRMIGVDLEARQVEGAAMAMRAVLAAAAEEAADGIVQNGDHAALAQPLAEAGDADGHARVDLRARPVDRADDDAVARRRQAHAHVGPDAEGAVLRARQAAMPAVEDLNAQALVGLQMQKVSQRLFARHSAGALVAS